MLCRHVLKPCQTELLSFLLSHEIVRLLRGGRNHTHKAITKNFWLGGQQKGEDLYNLSSILISGLSFFLGFTEGCWLRFQRVFFNVLPHILFLFICFCFQPSFTVIHGCALAVLQVHQKQGQPAGRSECFLALMRPECAWSMSTVGLTAQEISFPIENPFLRGSYCHSMAGSKPSWSYRHELDK